LIKKEAVSYQIQEQYVFYGRLIVATLYSDIRLSEIIVFSRNNENKHQRNFFFNGISLPIRDKPIIYSISTAFFTLV